MSDLTPYLTPYRSDDRRVEGPLGTGTFTIEDGEVDHVRFRDPETGTWSEKSIKATDEELRQREIDGLSRGLASVEHRLATLAPNDVMPYEKPRTEEQMRELRDGLEAEKAYIIDRLVDLGEKFPLPRKR